MMPSELTRRSFLVRTSAALGALALSDPLGAEDAPAEARYWKALDGSKVQCELCPWTCVIADGGRGRCGVRENQKGRLTSLVYGKSATFHEDPIEKKPFFHVLPGSTAFSLGTAGCNLECKFCQNWELARRRPEELPSYPMFPETVVQEALSRQCQSIAFTYNEPVILTEMIIDTARAARSSGLKTVVVSNGFINPAPLSDLAQSVSAYKVDLKSFRDTFYRDIASGKLQPVLDTLVSLRRQKVWTEIVYLVIPTLNDDDTQINDMTRWVSKELGPDVPVHFSRFYPQYRLANLPPTPTATLERARDIGLQNGLHFVYIGNLPGHPGENTPCPQCGKTVILRDGFSILENHLRDGTCAFCGRVIPGVWT
jgi:pyruvate formate lyase activating enzyme